MIYQLYTTAFGKYMTGRARTVHLSVAIYRENLRDISQLHKYYRSSPHRRFSKVYEKERVEFRLLNACLRRGISFPEFWGSINATVSNLGPDLLCK